MNKLQISVTKNSLIAYIPFGKRGITIYSFQKPSIRSRFWAFYDYLDHINDIKNVDAQLGKLDQALIGLSAQQKAAL